MAPFSRLLLLIGLAVAAAGLAVPAEAQTTKIRGHFFFYIAPGQPASRDSSFLGRPQLKTNTPLVHFGGGGEGLVTNRFGVGTDFGGIPHATNAGSLDVLSVNGFYHAIGGDHRVDPFLTAGVSGYFYDPNQKTARPNAGAGLNMHLGHTVGLTVEVRQSFGSALREVRVGLAVWQ